MLRWIYHSKSKTLKKLSSNWWIAEDKADLKKLEQIPSPKLALAVFRGIHGIDDGEWYLSDKGVKLPPGWIQCWYCDNEHYDHVKRRNSEIYLGVMYEYDEDEEEETPD